MLERLRVAVRLREPLEAVDLGFALLRAHLRPVYATWLSGFGLVALAAFLVFRRSPWKATLLLWWLCPLLDRLVLHVLGRATFGESPSLAESLRELPRILRHGVAAGLLWRRLSPWRAFLLPIWQLEAQDGRGYRRRSAQLLRRCMGSAGLLGAAMPLFALALVLAAFALLKLLAPVGTGLGLETPGNGWPAWATWAAALLPALALAFLEPFHVAGGFALYLNRRVQLEGWDLELAFRDLAARTRRLLGSALLLLACSFGPALAGRTPAPPAEAPRALEEVMRGPEFRTGHTERRLRWRAAPKPATRRHAAPPRWLMAFAALLAPLARGIVIAGLLFLLVLLLWRSRRHLARVLRREESSPAPETLFGLELRPESLPAELPRRARELWEQGAVRAALALLYRGALADLVHRRGVRVPRGATEAACVRLAEAVLDAEGGAFFRRLAALWARVAYGGAQPEAADAGLCEAWAVHFRAPGRGGAA